MGSSATLDYQSGRVDIRQDTDDGTTLTLQVEDANGDPYDLSAGTYTDTESVFTVDDTDAATGILVLTATGQDAGTYAYQIRDTVGEITWLAGYLLVGGVGGRRTGSSSSTQTLTVDDGTVTVQVATAATVPSSVVRGDGTPAVGDLLKVTSVSPLTVEGVDSGTYQTAMSPGAAAAGPLWTRLTMGQEPASVVALGDSTGNEDGEWFYDSMEWLATQFPAYTFLYRLWDDTAQGYGARTVIQTGTDGVRGIDLPGTTSVYISTPYDATFDITGDIDIRFSITPDDATPASRQCVGGRDSAYLVILDTNGDIELWWYSGTTFMSSAAGAGLTGITDATRIDVKITMDVDNGSSQHIVRYYTSADGGETWTLVATDTNAGTTTVDTAANPIKLGTRGPANAADLFTGEVHYFEVRDGIDGTLVASFDAALHDGVISTLVDANGLTWTVNGMASTSTTGAPGVLCLNGSKSGADIAYLDDATRIDLLVPDDLDPALVFLNVGHNEGATTSYRADYKALADALLAKNPDVGLVATIQNPQTAAATSPEKHAIRQRQVRDLALAERYGVVDVFRDFVEYGDWSADLMADTVHPNATGQARWTEKVKTLLRTA